MKKLLSILLSVAMIIGLIGPVVAVEETRSVEPAATGSEEKTGEVANSTEPVLSVMARTMTCYEGGYGAVPTAYRCSVDLAAASYSEWFEISYGDGLVESWPTEAGSYSVTFDVVHTVNGTEYLFTVPMAIEILPMPETSGQCGDSMYWNFDTENDTLYIWGEGDMYTVAASREDYWDENYLYEPGWLRLPVRHVVVEEGVENLSDYAFAQVWNSYYTIHETLQLPTTLQAIPEMGFVCSTAMESLTIPEGITSLTGWPFGSPGNSFTALKELHLPSTLTQMDITTIMLSGLDNDTAQQTLETICFAGTQEQWDAIARVESQSIQDLFGDDYEVFYENWCKPFQEVFENVPVVCTGTETSGGAQITSLDITILSTQISVSSVCAEVAHDSYIDEETGEEVNSPEWMYYDWAEYCTVAAVIDGVTYESIRLSTLAEISGMNTGMMLSGGIIQNQSYENQWEVGGTYPVTYYIFQMEGDWETLWSVDLSVTICEPSPKLQLTDIVVDELAGEFDGEVRCYRWEEHGTMTATIDDQQYAGISMTELQELLGSENGRCYYTINAATGYEDDIVKLWEPYENPWTDGEELHALLTIYGDDGKTLLYNDVICVRLCPTQVDSFSIAPITYYAHDYSGDVVITAHYKDGTSEQTDDYSYNAVDEWPEEPGSYTMNFLVAGKFTVSAQVTVLPAPTSGNLGDTVAWTYDAQTDTMTLSGTGTAVVENNRSWMRLLMKLAPSKIVVGEGIEYLEEAIFHYGLFVEELVLPTSLKELPLAMIGFNGPTAGTSMEAEYGVLTGMSAIAIPEGITSLTTAAFYLCWGITDFYLPSTLEEIDLDTICSVVKLREEMGLAAADITIHFAGTQAQWDAVAHVVGDSRAEYGSGLTDEQLETLFATFTVICAEEDTEYDPAVMDLSGDGKVTAFDAQMLAEAKAGLRTLTEEQLSAIGTMRPEDILDYILGK